LSKSAVHFLIVPLTPSDSHSPSHRGERRKCRPQHLDLSSIRRQRNALADIILSATYPSPFKTPAVEASAYNDPSVRVEAQEPITNSSPLSPQLSQFSRELEEQLGPLPSSWSIRLSADKRIFFVNHSSGETTWHDPRLNTSGVIMSPTTLVIPDGNECQETKAGRYSVPSRRSSAEITAQGTPILPLTQSARIRISHWVAEERFKIRARNAKVTVLKSRSRMARMQKYMQPLVL